MEKEMFSMTCCCWAQVAAPWMFPVVWGCFSFCSAPNNRSWPFPRPHLEAHVHLHSLSLPSAPFTLSLDTFFLACFISPVLMLIYWWKGERVSSGKAFTPALPPRGEDGFYCRTSCGAQRVSKDCKDTHIQIYTHAHNGDTHCWNAHSPNYAHTQPWTHTYCLFTLFFLHPVGFFLSHTNKAASSQPNHNYKITSTNHEVVYSRTMANQN